MMLIYDTEENERSYNIIAGIPHGSILELWYYGMLRMIPASWATLLGSSKVCIILETTEGC